MSPHDTYPGQGRVLVIGLSPTVNRSVVEPLVELGVDAQGFTRPDEAAEHFDARDFDLIVFGRGIRGPLSDGLKRAFSDDNPDVRSAGVIAPVAVEQVLASLASDPRHPRFVHGVEVSTQVAEIAVTASVLDSCRLTFTVFRIDDGTLASEQVGYIKAKPGPLRWSSPVNHLQDANSLLVTAAGTEYHLHPFLR